MLVIHNTNVFGRTHSLPTTMGLIRAGAVTGVAYALWKVLEEKWVSNLTPEMRCKASPWIPLLIVFLIELLI